MNQKIQNIIEKEQADCDRTVATAHRMRDWIPKYVPILSALPSLRYCYYYANEQVIMSVKTREDLAAVRALHKGAWRKSQHNDDGEEMLRYVAEVEGVQIDIRVTELPPSCRIVEERRDVPETVVPAHTEVTRKLVCTDPTKAEAPRDKVLSVEREEARELEGAF